MNPNLHAAFDQSRFTVEKVARGKRKQTAASNEERISKTVENEAGLEASPVTIRRLLMDSKGTALARATTLQTFTTPT
jgi:hypothetical protein